MPRDCLGKCSDSWARIPFFQPRCNFFTVMMDFKPCARADEEFRSALSRKNPGQPFQISRTIHHYRKKFAADGEKRYLGSQQVEQASQAKPRKHPDPGLSLGVRKLGRHQAACARAVSDQEATSTVQASLASEVISSPGWKSSCAPLSDRPMEPSSAEGAPGAAAGTLAT